MNKQQLEFLQRKIHSLCAEKCKKYKGTPKEENEYEKSHAIVKKYQAKKDAFEDAAYQKARLIKNKYSDLVSTQFLFRKEGDILKEIEKLMEEMQKELSKL